MRRTVRLRLTALYGGLFLMAGAVLVALIYLLVEYSPLVLARGQQGLDQRQPLDLAEIAAQALDPYPAIDLETDIQLGPAPASGDQALLERLVTNLIDNAVRYNVPGGRIEVETATRAGRAVLRIANSGPPSRWTRREAQLVSVSGLTRSA